jgi:hypothetical protein
MEKTVGDLSPTLRETDGGVTSFGGRDRAGPDRVKIDLA